MLDAAKVVSGHKNWEIVNGRISGSGNEWGNGDEGKELKRLSD
jgi:hypothetical protein